MTSKPTRPELGRNNVLDRATTATGIRKIRSTRTVDGTSLTTTSSAPRSVPADTPGLPKLQQGVDFKPAIISAAFPLGPLDSEPYDVLVLSSNLVYFAVHSHQLLAASGNEFCYRLPLSAEARRSVSGEDALYVLTLPEDSAVLNIVLHIICDLSYEQHSPSLAVLAPSWMCSRPMPSHGHTTSCPAKLEVHLEFGRIYNSIYADDKNFALWWGALHLGDFQVSSNTSAYVHRMGLIPP